MPLFFTRPKVDDETKANEKVNNKNDTFAKPNNDQPFARQMSASGSKVIKLFIF